MALVDTKLRENQAQLCTQQHRLRHLQSISACAIQACVDCIQLHFTMHLSTTSPDFYASEKCNDIVNPKWRCFDISQFPEYVNTSVSSVVIRIWCQHETDDHVIVEWTVFLTGLQFIGDQIVKSDRKFKPNTIVFRMHNYYYTDPSSLQFLSPSKTNEKFELFRRFEIDKQLVRRSYSISTLLRIHTIQRAMKQTQVSIWKLRGRINERLQDVQINEGKRSEKEYVRMFLGTLRSQLQYEKTKVMNQREKLSRLIGIAHDRNYELVKSLEAFRVERDNFIDTRVRSGQSRELLLKTNAELALRRRQLISELPYIYPVAELSNKGFTICKVHLPNSEDFVGHNETKIAAALGYVTHCVMMIAQFLDTPLRYSVKHLGSRSIISDHIVLKIPDKERDFPLYSKGKNKIQFNYAVYLLNKNISQLRFFCGMTTLDLRTTLQNLHGLIQMDLGIRLERQSSSSHSLSYSQSIPSSSSNLEQKVVSLARNDRMTPTDYFLLLQKTSQASHLDTEQDILANGNALSCSLDKGLDELQVSPTSDRVRRKRNSSCRSGLTHCTGSEPNLARGQTLHMVQIESEGSPSSCEDAVRSFAVGMELWANGSSRGTASSQTNSEDDVNEGANDSQQSKAVNTDAVSNIR